MKISSKSTRGGLSQRLDIFRQIPWKSVPFIILSLPSNAKKYFFTVSSYSWMNEKDEKVEWKKEKLFITFL